MNYISARIPQLAGNLLANIITANQGGLVTITQQDIINWLQAYSEVVATQPISLNMVRPDYEGIKQQLQAILSTDDSWGDLIQAGVGETLLEFVATIGTYAQLSIQRSLQETFLDTAKLQSSIYEATRMLGVHINRNPPASVSVNLICSNPSLSTFIIPRYSQFSINNLPFFNNTIIVVNSDGSNTVPVTLYQGTVIIDSFISNGSFYQRYEVGNADFSISNNDIVVFDQNFNEYDSYIGGMWDLQGSSLNFFENTTPNGNVELIFGNNIYGASPASLDTLNIVYVSTLAGNGVNNGSGFNVILNDLNTVVTERVRATSVASVNDLTNQIIGSISGITTSPVTYLGDAPDINFYSTCASKLYSAKNRMVTRPDFYSTLLTYPGLADVYVQGQAELAPKNRQYTNVIGVTPLPTSGIPMTDAQFAALVTWMQARTIGQIDYINIPPKPNLVNVSATLYCLQGSDIPKTITYVQYLLKNQFQIRRGSLGYSMYKNDLYSILKCQHFQLQVDYAELFSPTSDIVVSALDYIVINNTNITADYSERYYQSFVPNTPFQ